jgi:hypothetical protein
MTDKQFGMNQEGTKGTKQRLNTRHTSLLRCFVVQLNRGSNTRADRRVEDNENHLISG